MLGLIYKDLMTLKRSLGFSFLWFLAFGVFCGYLSSLDFFCGVVSVFCAVLPLTTMSYDSQWGWETFALSTGISRRTMALSRYVLCLLLTLAAVVINFLMRAFLAQDSSVLESLAIVLAIAGASLMMMALMMPLMYKFGVEKGRMFLMLVVFLVMGLSFFAEKVLWPHVIWPFFGANIMDSFLIRNLAWILPLIGVAGLAISVLISLRIYAKKEF
ncbi:MAG: ABC-2 transporter permease [Bacillota bacterium]|nr:ABC-2 transporter permease [Bacillota bacterium]